MALSTRLFNSEENSEIMQILPHPENSHSSSRVMTIFLYMLRKGLLSELSTQYIFFISKKIQFSVGQNELNGYLHH